jgi:hypothetical protein
MLDGCGRVLLFRGTGWMSRCIEFCTHSPVSHAALLLPDGYTVLESMQGAGVRKRILQESDWANIECYLVRGMTVKRWHHVIADAESELGCPYDWWSLFCWLFRSSRKLPHLTKYFCSELVHEKLRLHGVELVARKYDWEVTPADLRGATLLMLTGERP